MARSTATSWRCHCTRAERLASLLVACAPEDMGYRVFRGPNRTSLRARTGVLRLSRFAPRRVRMN
eukprot:9202154-Alexandrium_andersonii.AAC.1